MKKSYLTLAAAALAFAACSDNTVKTDVQEDVVEIGFANGYIDKTTKAELTNDWFKNTTYSTDPHSFGVYGYKGETQIYGTVTKDASSNVTATPSEKVTWSGADWTHTTVRFWDKSATNYEFYAYAPYEQTPMFQDKKFTFSSLVAAPIKDITTANADLAIATPLTGISYYSCNQTSVQGHGTGHVEFTFNHILSKLSFQVKTTLTTSADNGTTHDVDKILIKNISLDFPTATSASWSQAAASSVDGTTSFDTYKAKDGIDQNGKPIPANYETVVYSEGTATNYQSVSQTVASIGNTFIVAPVNADAKEHVFGVKVTYNIVYNDGTTDPDCVSYGVIGGGTEAVYYTETEAAEYNEAHKNDQGFVTVTTSTVKTAASGTVYKPTQNSNYVVTLVVGPEKIEFCVNSINDWTAKTIDDVPVNQ